MFGVLKRFLVGQPLDTSKQHEQKLSKRIALAVFSSDALSSVAYASEAILVVLVVAGATALPVVMEVSAAIVFLLAIVGFSYRQTIHAYPNGGGAYIVAHENLGEIPGLVACVLNLCPFAGLFGTLFQIGFR
jgi:amino acid transporter